MNIIAPGAMIRFGWETFKKRPWFFIGIELIVVLVSGIASQMGGYVEKAQTPMLVTLALAGVFIGMVIQILLKMGTISLFLKAHESPEATKVSDLWGPAHFWKYVLASIVVGIIVVGGILLLIIPGIIWALRYMFVPYLVIDRGLGVRASLKESARITYGHKWQLLGLMGVLFLLNFAGLIALIVGLLVTVPITALVVVHAYRTLEHSASEVVPSPVA